MDELKNSHVLDEETVALLSKLEEQKHVPKGYSLKNGLILKKECIWIVANNPFKEKLLHYVQTNPQAGHSGFLKNYQ